MSGRWFRRRRAVECVAPVHIPARFRRFHAGDRWHSLPSPGPPASLSLLPGVTEVTNMTRHQLIHAFCEVKAAGLAPVGPACPTTLDSSNRTSDITNREIAFIFFKDKGS